MKEEEGGGTLGAGRRVCTHHHNASRLLRGAHAHNGSHADGGPLEVDPAAKDRGPKIIRWTKTQKLFDDNPRGSDFRI